MIDFGEQNAIGQRRVESFVCSIGAGNLLLILSDLDFSRINLEIWWKVVNPLIVGLSGYKSFKVVEESECAQDKIVRLGRLLWQSNCREELELLFRIFGEAKVNNYLFCS